MSDTDKIAKQNGSTAFPLQDLEYIRSISPDEMTDQEFFEFLDPTEARHNIYLEIVFNDSDESSK